MSVDELYRKSRRVALWGIVTGLALGVVKCLGGLFGHSFALLSDSVHSFGDALSSSALLGALILSQRPADPEHPYGYTRAETVAGSSAALLLILSGIWIGWEALIHFLEEYQTPATYTLWIALASAVLKEGLFWYNRRAARRSGSTALMASAWDHRLDAMNSMVVVGGVALAKWGCPDWHWADHGAAAIVAAVVVWVGIKLFWNNLHELLDRQADSGLVQRVRTEAGAVPGVWGVEKLHVRKVGLEYLVDIHVEVDPDIPVREGHAIAHAVKDQLLKKTPLVKDVLVHIEPAPGSWIVHEGAAKPQAAVPEANPRRPASP